MSQKTGTINEWLSLAAFIFSASLLLVPLASSHPDTELMDFISNIDDPFMTATDLAFVLVTHDFDATPRGDYVEVRTGDAVYRLKPGGSHPELAEATHV